MAEVLALALDAPLGAGTQQDDAEADDGSDGDADGQ
jgi:hypothetical protein